jgi:hypothetical protein
MSSGDEENDVASTFSELDNAISTGDWAKVGVTASILASSAHSGDTLSLKSSKSGGSSGRKNKATTLDARRAAELDRLVEAGDWEGVMKAASRMVSEDSILLSFEYSIFTATQASHRFQRFF